MRNATIFRFPLAVAAAILADVSQFDRDIADCAIKPVGPLEVESRGFVPLLPPDPAIPADEGDLAIPFWAGESVIALVMEVQTKILPAAVVNKLLAERLAKAEEQNGRKLGGKARRRLKEELIHELLPRAFVRPKRVQGYLDLKRGLCVVDASGRTAAEQFVSLIRQARGSFPALPLNCERSVRAELTHALQEGGDWGIFQIGANARFSTGGNDPKATLRQFEGLAGSDEVRSLIEAGMTPERVELYFGSLLRLDFDEDLRFRRLQLLDTAQDQLTDIEAEDLSTATEAQLLIITGAIGQAWDRLNELVRFSEVS